MLELHGVDIALEIVNHATHDIADVGGAFAEVFVFDHAESGGVTFGDLGKSELGVDFLLLDRADDFGDEGLIFENEQVSFEDTGAFGSHPFLDLALDLSDLLPGLEQGAFHPIDLQVAFALGDVVLGDGVRLTSDTTARPWQTPAETGMPRNTFSPVRAGSGMFLLYLAGVGLETKYFLKTAVALIIRLESERN